MALPYLLQECRHVSTILICICLLSMLLTASMCSITVTVEDPFIQLLTTAKLDSFGIESFDKLQPGLYGNYQTDFGNTDYNGTYYNVEIVPRDELGGAEGIGFYPVSRNMRPYRLILTQSGTRANYFGLWWSAMDPYNQLAFYYQGNAVFLLWPETIRELLQEHATDYMGNPTYQPRENMEQSYVFVNIFFGDSGYDEVRFYELFFGFESDNHIVGHYPESMAAEVTETQAKKALPFKALAGGIAGLSVLLLAGVFAVRYLKPPDTNPVVREFEEASPNSPDREARIFIGQHVFR